MSQTPASPDKRVPQQLVRAALAEGLLIVGVALYFFVAPQSVLTIVLSALAFVAGVIVAVFAIYKAVPLMSEPATRSIGYVTVAIIIIGPILVFAVSQFV